MVVFTKESLDTLRQRVDLVDFLSARMELKRSGASYKGLCPFHDEKTPSFIVQKGDRHYHCFGCGVHGDAIHYLITREGMTFKEAVETLAERFSVPLELSLELEKNDQVPLIKAALDKASLFFQFFLLRTEEGREALSYLITRGLTLEFIKRFRLGLAPKAMGLFRKFMHENNFSDDILVESGLLTKTDEGKLREFFNERITFPIHHASGAIIGFSARKIKESVFGGKYVNTRETPVFKKSRTLFGLNYSRKRIAKERRVIIVEGQIDALRLIDGGFDLTVAAQGTAFGEGHLEELMRLGVQTAYLVLDGDKAGKEAACKIGELFLKEGLEARVVVLPEKEDPDSFLKNKGFEAFEELLKGAIEYIEFLFHHRSGLKDMNSPAIKTQVISEIRGQVREWKSEVLVHESLKKLAKLANLPESTLLSAMSIKPPEFIKREAFTSYKPLDPHKILESDFLRWLILASSEKKRFMSWAKNNILPDYFHTEICKALYQEILAAHFNGTHFDWIEAIANEETEDHQRLLQEILEKKVDRSKAEEHFKETMSKIMLRNWMEKREAIKIKIQSGLLTEEEAFSLAKEFDDLRKTPPQLNLTLE